jgi:hypothetical protein
METLPNEGPLTGEDSNDGAPTPDEVLLTGEDSQGGVTDDDSITEPSIPLTGDDQPTLGPATDDDEPPEPQGDDDFETPTIPLSDAPSATPSEAVGEFPTGDPTFGPPSSAPIPSIPEDDDAIAPTKAPTSESGVPSTEAPTSDDDEVSNDPIDVIGGEDDPDEDVSNDGMDRNGPPGSDGIPGLPPLETEDDATPSNDPDQRTLL